MHIIFNSGIMPEAGMIFLSLFISLIKIDCMKTKELVAEASVDIKAKSKDVWDALTDSEKIRQYMFGTEVTSQWKEGSKIVWKGEWNGKFFEDLGTITQFKPGQVLEYTHYSADSGAGKEPENVHNVTTTLDEKGNQTRVTISQDGNKNDEEKKHSEQNWKKILESLKTFVEKSEVNA